MKKEEIFRGRKTEKTELLIICNTQNKLQNYTNEQTKNLGQNEQ